MNENFEIPLPPCVSCRYALRAPRGYVEACGRYEGRNSIESYSRCVKAAAELSCKEYESRENAQKPA